MSATLGGAWGEEQPSSARMDAKSIFVGTGDEIAAITITSTIPFALCTADGSGFLANHLYHRHYDDVLVGWSGWDDVFRKHTHADDTESEGGDYYDIDVQNAATRLSIFRPSLTEEYFLWDNNGGTITHIAANNSQKIRLNTGTSSGNWSQIQDGGLQVSLSSKMEWHVKFQIDAPGTPPPVLWRMGVGMERVEEASETTLQKFGLEGCQGDGIAIQLVSCNGSSRIKTSTQVAMDQSASIGTKVTYVPSTSVTYTDTLGTVKQSTGGFPSSGSVHSDKMLRYGIKTNNTTDKIMWLWADALFGKILDPSWI